MAVIANHKNQLNRLSFSRIPTHMYIHAQEKKKYPHTDTLYACIHHCSIQEIQNNKPWMDYKIQSINQLQTKKKKNPCY